MTVVSAMKFNDKEGAIVADEQSSTHLRKYDIAEKIHSVEQEGRIVLFGGSGSSNFLFQASEEIDEIVRKNNLKSARKIADVIGYVMTQLRRKHADSYLKANSDVCLLDLQRGYKIDPEQGKVELEGGFKQSVWSNLSANKDLEGFLTNMFLILASDSDGTQIYTASTSREAVVPCARPYECIGSGSDMADAELGDFFDHILREERKSIDPTMGIAQLLHATERASKVNVGVGGTPAIVAIREGKIIRPSENNSRLASEMVRAWKKGCLDQDWVMSRLHSLVYANANYQEIDKEMWKAARNPEKLNFMLRGYKI